MATPHGSLNYTNVDVSGKYVERCFIIGFFSAAIYRYGGSALSTLLMSIPMSLVQHPKEQTTYCGYRCRHPLIQEQCY